MTVPQLSQLGNIAVFKLLRIHISSKLEKSMDLLKLLGKEQLVALLNILMTKNCQLNTKTYYVHDAMIEFLSFQMYINDNSSSSLHTDSKGLMFTLFWSIPGFPAGNA